MTSEIKAMIMTLVMTIACASFFIYGPAQKVTRTYEEKSGIIINKDTSRVNVGKNGVYTEYLFIVKRLENVEKVQVGVDSFYKLNANDEYKWKEDHTDVKSLSTTEVVVNFIAFVTMVLSGICFIILVLSELV